MNENSRSFADRAGLDGDTFGRLLDWLSIPSVSSDPACSQGVEDAARWICDYMRDVPGCEIELAWLPGSRHPAVVGRVAASPGRTAGPTVSVYGHFDVQPPGRHEDWITPPFSPDIRSGRIYARGAADSKINSFIVLETIRRLTNSRSLPVNLELLLDGEEEIDGVAIPRYAAGRPLPDAAFICDGSLRPDGSPHLTVSLRGTLYYRLTLRAAERELHSGAFGGAALNAAGALIACLYNATLAPLGDRPAQRVDVVDCAREEGAEALHLAGARPSDPSAAAEFHERTTLWSAVDVNSIGAGEVELQKTAIPDLATANVSIRVGPYDDHQRLDEEFRSRLHDVTPDGADLAVESLAVVPPGMVNTDSEPLRLAADAFERAYGTPAHLTRSGGTLPLFSTYTARGVPVIETGFASEDGAAHAVNESFPLRNLPPGLSACAELFESLGRLAATPS